MTERVETAEATAVPLEVTWRIHLLDIWVVAAAETMAVEGEAHNTIQVWPYVCLSVCPGKVLGSIVVVQHVLLPSSS